MEFAVKRGMVAKVVIAFLAVLVVSLLAFAPATVPNAWADTQSSQSVKWEKSESKVFCYVDGKKAKGLTKIGKRTYYFTGEGVQYTGWAKISGLYRYFRISNGSGGYMVKSKVVNGISLDASGVAKINSTANAELDLMVTANKTLRTLTNPCDSKSSKMKACFYYQVRTCSQRGTRPFKATAGWHRTFAADILNGKSGSCESHAAAYAYFANAIGCKDVKVICSGGHAWAEVNGKVYDPQWSSGRENPYAFYAVPYSRSGVNGTPNYKANRVYIVTLTPNTTLWGGKGKVMSKNGLIKNKDGSFSYYAEGVKLINAWKTIGKYKYYFKSNGKSAVGSCKVGKTYYVFSSSSRLLTGNGTRVVTVSGVKYRVDSKGKAASGWSSDKSRCYLATGAVACGVHVIKGALQAFSSSGKYNSELSAQLQAACIEGKDVTPLIELLGTPKKHTYADSCMVVDGSTGKDGFIVYDNVKVTTFLADDDGVEYLMSVEEI